MKTETHQLVVPPEKAGERLDLFIGHALGLSRAKLKKLFEDAAVAVNGRPGKKGQLVTAGQQIVVQVVTESTAAVAEERPSFELVVLHEDPALVFVNKPAGVPSHPLRPGETGTVANALIARYPECADSSEDAREGGLCHRLDIETSGVMVAARSRADWEKVRAGFSGRDVDKKYWALVTGPIADDGEIDLPLRHHPRHADRVEPAMDAGEPGREALSRFRVLARSGEYSLVEVTILTGVLHQVRAHLSAIGASIVGDALYGGREHPGLGRFFLHARTLVVVHPRTRERVEVTAELPEDLKRTLAEVAIAP